MPYKKLFPTLRDKKWGCVNLNLIAQQQELPRGRSRLLDHTICEAFIGNVHRGRNIEASWGGWMEDRKDLWRGSYMEADGKYVTLGVDFNVPANTPVSLPFNGKLLAVDDDYPRKLGWGNRAFVSCGEEFVLIFAHLRAPLGARVGSIIEKEQCFAEVASPAQNGGWYPHLRVQAMARLYYDLLVEYKRIGDLDGYVSPNQLDWALKRFYDPLPFLM